MSDDKNVHLALFAPHDGGSPLRPLSCSQKAPRSFRLSKPPQPLELYTSYAGSIAGTSKTFTIRRVSPAVIASTCVCNSAVCVLRPSHFCVRNPHRQFLARAELGMVNLMIADSSAMVSPDFLRHGPRCRLPKVVLRQYGKRPRAKPT